MSSRPINAIIYDSIQVSPIIALCITHLTQSRCSFRDFWLRSLSKCPGCCQVWHFSRWTSLTNTDSQPKSSPFVGGAIADRRFWGVKMCLKEIWRRMRGGLAIRRLKERCRRSWTGDQVIKRSLDWAHKMC